MSEIKISVIVPIYNVEIYIERALISLAKQSFKHFEVIMVNDCSTDKSGIIANKYANEYDNFKLINLEKNSGLSNARNKGLEVAVGECVTFFDSDDRYDTEFLSKMYNKLIESDADVVYCNYALHFYDADIKYKILCRKPFNKIYTGKQMSKLTSADFRGRSYIWNKLWKKSLFTQNPQITFPDMCYEDLAVVSILFRRAKKVAVINDCLYYYTQRKDSIIASMTEKKLNEYHHALYLLKSHFQKNDDYSYYKFAIFRLFLSMFFCVSINVLRIKSFDSKDMTYIKLMAKEYKKLIKIITTDYSKD